MNRKDRFSLDIPIIDMHEIMLFGINDDVQLSPEHSLQLSACSNNSRALRCRTILLFLQHSRFLFQARQPRALFLAAFC